MNLWAISLFTLIFIVQTMRRHQFQWLWFAVAVWLSLGILSGRVLPHILGITTWTNLYLVHFYAFLGSVFFFINSVEKLPKPENKQNAAQMWHSPKAGVWLTLFALSGLVMHVAFLIWSVLVWWVYPEGYTSLLLIRLLFLYVSEPVYWYSLQLLIMLIFALHRLMVREALHVFSLPQLQMGLMLCLMLFLLKLFNLDNYLWFLLIK